MSQDDDYKKKFRIITNDEPKEEEGGESGESGTGGRSGQIEFREFIGVLPLRDDLLTGEEKRRLLAVHEGAHESAVKKQKDTRDQRQLLKEGKVSLPAYRQGLAASGGVSQYKSHPTLSNKAQFSGMDRQVNSLPNEQISDTNNDKRQELQYQYNLVHRPQHAMRFNPKPLHG